MKEKDKRAARKELGLKLKSMRERIKPKITQEDVAARVKAEGTYIGQIEQGVRFPGDDLLELLCIVYKATGNEFDECFAIKYPDHKVRFSGDSTPQPEFPNDRMIYLAQKKGLIPKILGAIVPEAYEALRTSSGTEGVTFTSPEQVKKQLEYIKGKFPELRARIEFCELYESDELSGEDIAEINTFTRFVIERNRKASDKS